VSEARKYDHNHHDWNILKHDWVASFSCPRSEHHEAGTKHPDEKLTEKFIFPPPLSVAGGVPRIIPA
jgi:hypothetical protein